MRAVEGPVVIAARFCGPPFSGNGGYTAGVVARALAAPVAEVTLRKPPPVERPLELTRGNDRAFLKQGDELVADAVPAALDLDVPRRVGRDEAEAASRSYPGFAQHSFPTCFVCGPQRSPEDGLRIFAGPADGVYAAPWTPDATLDEGDGLAAPEFVWAALDCPGAIAVGYPYRGETLLGRIVAHVERRPEIGERCVVVAWPLGEEGRKRYAGTAVLGADGEVAARARSIWIEPRPAE